jgi:hypothetical protein
MYKYNSLCIFFILLKSQLITDSKKANVDFNIKKLVNYIKTMPLKKSRTL